MPIETRFARIHMEVMVKRRLPEGGKHLADLVKEYGLHTQAQEAFWVIANGQTGYIHTIIEVARGRHDAVQVSIPDVLTAVLAAGAPTFSVAHNHPTMSAIPSQADRNLTNNIMLAANACGLIFEEHVVVEPGGDYFSFRDAGMIVGEFRKSRVSTTAPTSSRPATTLQPCSIHPACDRLFRPGSSGATSHVARINGKSVQS